MTHLTRDELVHWREVGAPEDRERVIGHLAACQSCRREYAELVRLSTPAESPAVLDPQRFNARGLAAFGPRRPLWRRPAVWLALPAAAAVGLLVMVLRPSPGPPLSEPTSEVRGGEVVAESPRGSVASLGEFRWRSAYAAPRYRVTVRDQAATVVFTAESAGERLSFPPDRHLPAGRYTWSVDAIDRSGRVIATSREQAFTLAPPR